MNIDSPEEKYSVAKLLDTGMFDVVGKLHVTDLYLSNVIMGRVTELDSAGLAKKTGTVENPMRVKPIAIEGSPIRRPLICDGCIFAVDYRTGRNAQRIYWWNASAREVTPFDYERDFTEGSFRSFVEQVYRDVGREDDIIVSDEASSSEGDTEAKATVSGESA